MRRTYTDAERAQALELYAAQGPTAVQEQLGIAKGTVTGWARANGVRTVRNETTAAATAAAVVSIAERKTRLAKDLMGDIERLRTQLFTPCKVRKVVTLAGGKERGEAEVVDVELEQPSFADQRQIMTTLAIAVDKVQVLTGQATEILEHRVSSPIDEELARLSAELEHQQPESVDA